MIYLLTTENPALDKEIDSIEARLTKLETPAAVTQKPAVASAQNQVTVGVRTLSKSYLVSGDVTLAQSGALTITQAGNGFTFAVPFATAVPLVDSGAGAVGTSVKLAREDHVHPTSSGALSSSGARVTKNAAQTIANNTLTALTWNTERYDTAAYHESVTNPTRLTIPATDYYTITANIEWNHNSTGVTSYTLSIRLNGTTTIATTTAVTDVGSTALQSVQLTDQLLASADYLEIMVQQVNALIGSIDVNTHGDYSPVATISVIQ